jgi:hypothetical protein
MGRSVSPRTETNNDHRRSQSGTGMILHSKTAKATKGQFSVSNLWGLRGLVVKFVSVFASLRKIPCAWLSLCRMQDPESFANQRHPLVKTPILKALATEEIAVSLSPIGQ